MIEIFPGIFSDSYSEKDLEGILLNSEGREIGLFLDLDGTIHRGMFNGLFYNSSSADLAFLLLPYAIKHGIDSVLNYAADGVYFTSKVLAYKMGIKRLEREQDLLSIVEEFSERVLTRFYYEEVHAAARSISRFSYPYSISTLSQISRNYKKTVLISTTFYPVLEEYVKKIGENIFHIEAYATKLLERDGRILGILGKVVDSYQKKKFLIQSAESLEGAVLFLNADEDLEMLSAAENIFGRKNTIKIAINKPTMGVINASDFYVKSWKSIYALINRTKKQ
ncbi:MAG: hypothetical protein QXW00_00390 [Candidatus Woesearchaeota archaeon]